MLSDFALTYCRSKRAKKNGEMEGRNALCSINMRLIAISIPQLGDPVHKYVRSPLTLRWSSRIEEYTLCHIEDIATCMVIYSLTINVPFPTKIKSLLTAAVALLSQYFEYGILGLKR